MTSNELEEALGDAEDAFQRRPENPEVGLEYVSDSSVLQLRKACRSSTPRDSSSTATATSR